MYETFTYNQIKDLPEDQKIEALKELKTMFPDNKELAVHLNVIPMAISNMVAKYVEGKQMGRKKMTAEEKAQAKLKREAEKKLKERQEIEKEKEKITQQEKSDEQKVDEVVKSQEIKNEETNVKSIAEESKSIPLQSNSSSFSIKLDKNMVGEEAVSRLNGIANSLLKEKEYKIELVIAEA
jgi:ATP-dependent Clp protease ATP-binding subunit ClpA